MLADKPGATWIVLFTPSAAVLHFAAAPSGGTYAASVRKTAAVVARFHCRVVVGATRSDYAYPVGFLYALRRSAAQHFAILRRPVIAINGTIEPVVYWLQLLSSLVGGVGLIVLYILWLKRQPNKANDGSESDGWRYSLLAVVVVLSLVVAMAAAYHHTLPFTVGPTFNEFVYWIAVYSILRFPLVSLSALIVYFGNANRRV